MCASLPPFRATTLWCEANVGAPRSERNHPELPRRHRAVRRDARRRVGRDPRDRRSERRREDEPPQLHLRSVPAAAWDDPLRRPRRLEARAVGADRARDRADVPEHRAVPRHDRARQPPHRAARPPAHGGGRRLRVPRPRAARGDRAPQGGRGHHRLPRDPARSQEGGRYARLRAAEARRARPRAGARPDAPPPRRADGGDERGGEAGHGALRRGDPRGARDHHPHDRARHGRS